MRISRRTTVAVAIAATAALAATGVAVANTASNGNVSSVKFLESPNKVPKKKFVKGALTLGTKTVFNPALPTDNGGDTHRVQVWIDDDIKLNVNAAPKCNPAFSSNTTMQQAMQQCGNAKIGQGRAHSANTAGNVPGCVLTFNGTNKRVILFTRLFTGTLDCGSPSTNTGGDLSVTLFGKLKPASGDYGTQLDVNNIDNITPAPLGDFFSRIKRKNYITARCHDGNHKWNVKGKHTYTDGVTSVDKVKETCHVK
jgi:hypothetical protein